MRWAQFAKGGAVAVRASTAPDARVGNEDFLVLQIVIKHLLEFGHSHARESGCSGENWPEALDLQIF